MKICGKCGELKAQNIIEAPVVHASGSLNVQTIVIRSLAGAVIGKKKR